MGAELLIQRAEGPLGEPPLPVENGFRPQGSRLGQEEAQGGLALPAGERAAAGRRARRRYPEALPFLPEAGAQGPQANASQER